MAYFKVLSQHLSERTEERHKKTAMTANTEIHIG